MERKAKIQDDLKAVMSRYAKGRRFHRIEITDYPGRLL
jgi:hypothetical protein